MSKGLGIAALVLSILAIFVPVVSIFLVVLAMILCASAAILGERTLPIASWVVSTVNLLFLSPFVWAGLATDRMQGKSNWKLIVGLILLLPLAAIVFGFMKGRTKSSIVSTGSPNPDAPVKAVAEHTLAVKVPDTSESTQIAGAVSGTDFRSCPFCAEVIRVQAKKCRFCGSVIDPIGSAKKPAELDTSNQAVNLSLAANEASTLMLPAAPPPPPFRANDDHTAEQNAIGNVRAMPAQSRASRLPVSRQLWLGAAIMAAIIVGGAVLYYAKTSNSGVVADIVTSPSRSDDVVAAVSPLPQISNPTRIETAPQGALNPRWYASWIDQKNGKKLTISSASFGDCPWADNMNEIPKRAGCWAYYGTSQTLGEIVGTGRAMIDPASSSIAQTVSPADRYKVVRILRRDERGDDLVSDCDLVYFYDRERVVSRNWCQVENSQRVNLTVFENSTTPNPPALNKMSSMSLYLSDEFDGDSLDSDKWISKGNRVEVQRGYVSMQAAQTDNTGQIWTNNLPPLSKVKLTMRHWMQPGGSQPFFPMVLLRDDAQKNIVDLRWLRSSHTADYCNVPSNYDKPLLHAGGTMCVVVGSTSASVFYGKWVDTSITYDATTGQYSATSTAAGAPTLQLNYVLPPTHRSKVKDVYLSGYGWFTGHEHRVDRIRIEGQP